MIAVGATGVGKSTLLNALLCPSRLTNEREDCFFRTDDTAESVTKNIKFESGSWLGENGTSPRMVKLYDTPGLGDSGGSDSDTLTGIVDRINSEGANIRTILLVFKATDRFSSNIQKQLKTLEYILGGNARRYTVFLVVCPGITVVLNKRLWETIVKYHKKKLNR